MLTASLAMAAAATSLHGGKSQLLHSIQSHTNLKVLVQRKSCRMVSAGCHVRSSADGTRAAVKLAPVGSLEADVLEKEGAVYMQLQSLQGRTVPKLLACGPFDQQKSFMLATSLIRQVNLTSLTLSAS